MPQIFKFGLKYIYALVSSLYLFTLGVFVRKHRGLISRIFDHFDWRSRPVKLLPMMTWDDLQCSDDSIELIKPQPADGNISLLETAVITKLIKTYQPQSIFEFGTYDGRTTLHMAANAAENCQIHTLDLPPQETQETQFDLSPVERKYAEKSVVGKYYKNSSYANKIKQLLGDSATFDFKPYENSADFIFIDASHVYDYVKNDSMQALKLLRNGKGIILWHDYTLWWDGVVQALQELYHKDERFKDLKYIEGTTLAYLHLS